MPKALLGGTFPSGTTLIRVVCQRPSHLKAVSTALLLAALLLHRAAPCRTYVRLLTVRMQKDMKLRKRRPRPYQMQYPNTKSSCNSLQQHNRRTNQWQKQ
jgi:hypothetical protein